MAPALRSQIEGRYVLIGGDIQDLDEYENSDDPRSAAQFTKGLEVHAHLLAQLLDGRMPRSISPAGRCGSPRSGWSPPAR